MEEPEKPAIRIFVDADACPVKAEIYRVAERYGLKVFVVANSFMNVPRSDMIERVIVNEGPDVADNWIAERAGSSDIVITADIPLAGALREKRRGGDRSDRQAVHRRFDRHGVGHARPAHGFAQRRRHHARAAAAEPSGYFAIFVGARSGGDAAASGNKPVTHSAAVATPPCAFDQPAGSFMNFSTSASILASNFPLALATASTSHQVVSACSVTPRSARIFLPSG